MANYVKGKWYKCNEWSSRQDFCKAGDQVSQGIRYSEKIYNGIYEKIPGSWGEGRGLIEASPEEYSDFLPDGHPDKIVKPVLIGRWLECMQDNANSCVVNDKSVKKGDYVQIESFGKGHFKEYYTLKNGNYLGKLDEDAAFLRGEIVRGFKLMPIGFSPSTTQSTNTESFVGRYIRALRDYPNGTNLKKGEYAKINTDNGASINTDCGKIFTYDNKAVAISELERRGVELMPVGFSLPSDPTKTSSDPSNSTDTFIGRWFECLKDGANGCAVNGKIVKKGQYVQIVGSNPVGYTLKDGNYLGNPGDEKDIASFQAKRGYKLMPMGFTPPYYKQAGNDFSIVDGNWYVIENLSNESGSNKNYWNGKIGHVFQCDGKRSSETDAIYATEKTYCQGDCWYKYNIRPATPSEIETARRKYFPEEFLAEKLPVSSGSHSIHDSLIKLDSYDGFSVGSILYEAHLNLWVSKAGCRNKYEKSSGFHHCPGYFSSGDRQIELIAMIDDKVCFLVSGTSHVWILAEGYSKFINSLSVSKEEVSPPPDPVKKSIIASGYKEYGGFKVGDSLDIEIVNKVSGIEGNQYWDKKEDGGWKTGGGTWPITTNLYIDSFVLIDGYVCIRLSYSSKTEFYIKFDSYASAAKSKYQKEVERTASLFLDKVMPYQYYLLSDYEDDGLEFQSPVIVKKSTKKPKLVIL